jgi:hypothetical protein
VSLDPSGDRRITMCRALIQIRKVVGASLGFGLCPSPIWDMLLDLYLAHHERREVYLWPLCMAANTPLSTAHRKIAEMERRSLLVRETTAHDRRRISVRMTDEGLSKVTKLLERIDDICHSSSGTLEK